LARYLPGLAPRRRAPQDESLASLLARRDAVRSQQSNNAPAASPDLFVPERPAANSGAVPATPQGEAVPNPQSAKTDAEAPAARPAPATESASTASRLLEAKRRAQKRKGA
jgi:hypothetical protein